MKESKTCAANKHEEKTSTHHNPQHEPFFNRTSGMSGASVTQRRGIGGDWSNGQPFFTKKTASTPPVQARFKSNKTSSPEGKKESGPFRSTGYFFKEPSRQPFFIARPAKLNAFQDMANDSPQAKQTTQLQGMEDSHSAQEQLIQKKENNTGLPSNLKPGIENLSGYSMDDVKVHYNSDKPAQLQAYAYAQGTDIHLASGQEKHLPHEAWHVVQQKQGRVKPTAQLKGKVNINDNARLEKEADLMGAKAIQMKSNEFLKKKTNKSYFFKPTSDNGKNNLIQLQREPNQQDETQQQSETLEESLDRIAANYRAMIAAARSRKHTVAADNLQRFLDGTGGTKHESSTWLRSFGAINSAERTNQQRFEKSLKKRALSLADSSSITFTDYWDRALTASVFTELYYASGTSQITSTGTFTLTRIGNTVDITGNVTHVWNDPYDWHAGLAAFVPGFGSISDADALLLQQHRGAGPFDMTSSWTQTLSGTYKIDSFLYFDSSNFNWSP